MAHDTTAKKRGVGCLMPFAYWILLLLLYFNFGLPPPITGAFPEADARRFYIATVDRESGSPVYARSTLAAYREGGADAAGRDYRLADREIVIRDGDIDHVEVLEEHDDVQLIEYVHDNSALVASIYRAGETGIEPVSLRVIANVGSGLTALGLTVPAYVLAWLTGLWRRRRASSGAAGSEHTERDI